MALRKERKNNAGKIMAWVVAITMIASVFGIVLDYQMGGGNERYNGVSFQRLSTGTWNAKVQGQRQDFNFFPLELEAIPYDPGVSALMANAQMLIVVFDPQNRTDQELAIMDFISFDLSQRLPEKAFSAISAPDPKYALPIVSCANSSAAAVVIMIDGENESAVRVGDTCIHLGGYSQAALMSYDRLLYGYYEVMEDDVYLTYLDAVNATGG